MNPNNLPAQLKDQKAFLVWKYIHGKGGSKPRKVPHYASSGKWRHGVQGSSDDRRGLVSFKAALNVLKKSKKQYTGLGIAMLPDWGLVAVDFDDCVEHKEVHPWVYRLVAGTYWEFSPSGNGVRAFFKGHLRDAKSLGKGFDVEFFCSKGFVTVTGDVAPEVEFVGPEIIELTPEVMELYARSFGSKDVAVTNESQLSVGMTDAEIRKMMELWNPDCSYDVWLNIGMAIHHETHGEGFELWNDWSAKGVDYAGHEECQYKWESFGRDGRKSVKTIRWMLNEKPLDFQLENVGNDFGPLPLLTDGKGAEIKPIPALKLNRSGEVEASPENVVAWLRRTDLVNMQIADDEFRDEIMIQPHGATNEWAQLKDEDYMRFRMHLGQKNFKGVSKELVRDAITLVAKENPFDSAILWLKGLKWDGVSRVEKFMSRYLGAQDSPYTRAVALYAWTAHAGRIMDPGCKADMIPVLVGPQRRGKSECVAAIAPAPEFFAEMAFNHRDDDLARRMRGRLVVECAELSGLGGRETEAIKAFITRAQEDWVPKYKEHATKYSRRFIFWGTSNSDDFLNDATGNRRWLPFRVSGGDVRAIVRDRELLWAEARELWGLVGILDGAAANLGANVHEEFIAEDPWEEPIVEFLKTRDEKGELWSKCKILQSDIIMSEAVGLYAATRNNTTRMRLRNIMTRLNYILKVTRDENGHSVRGWVKV